MTDNTATAATSKKPSHYAYQVKDLGDDRKAVWNLIGAAWAHGDGKGFSIQLDSLPIDGRISLRDANERTSK